MSNSNSQSDKHRQKCKKQKFSQGIKDNMDVDTWIGPWDFLPAPENFACSPPFGPSFGSAVGEPAIETK